jgi:hypothetical protein
MRPRYIILHAPAYQWFVLDRVSRGIVASGLETREAAEAYVAAIQVPEPAATWTIIRDEDGVPVRMEL